VNGPTCFVVGEGITPLSCLEILASTGFSILGVYSPRGTLRPIAERHGFPHADTLEAFEAALLAEDFDFLFSINNGWIVPESVIQRARRAAINYHDSPLPKYRGVHATSWALLHGERDHAVSFHELTRAIDGGRLLKQRPVAIHPDDTALTLNTKCYEAAVLAFEELAQELCEGREQRTPQATADASYFGLRDRPSAACVLSFREPAPKIKNLVRALDFGPPKNPLGLPKVFTGTAFFTVRSAAVHAEGSSAAAGTVVAVEEDGLRVATSTCDVTLRGFRTLTGAPLTAADLGARFGIAVGRVLPELPDDVAQSLTARYAALSGHEVAWARRLQGLVPMSHPYAGTAASSTAPLRVALDLPAPAGTTSQREPPSAWGQPASDARTVLGWFAAYLARLSDEPIFDVGFCSPAQRSPVPNLFAPVVPLRIALAPEATFAHAQQTLLAELARCEELGTYALDLSCRDPDLRAGSARERLPIVLAIVESPRELDPTALDAELVLAAYQDGSSPELIARTPLKPWQIAAIGSQIAVLARTASEHPQTPLADLPLLTGEERERILVGWNQTAVPYPADRCIHELVALQAARTPAAPAVRFGGVSITYEELQRRAGVLAHRLRALGVRRGALVALCLPRSVEMVVGLLGILQAGAAYVPIDPAYPRERIAGIVADSEASVVVSLQKLRDSFFSNVPHVLCLDQAMEAAPPEDGAAMAADEAPTPGDLAYVIYTSGSTGKPKGVEIVHRGLVNHSCAIAKNYALGPGDRLLCSASISFDVAGEQIYPALFSGAEVVVRPDDLFESFTGFDRFVRSEGISAMVLPTAFWHEWVRDLSSSGATVPTGLRVLSVGTEKALGEFLETWQTVSQGRVKFFQGYGPTEASVTCTMYAHDGSAFDTERPLPIGRPMPNAEIYILDARLRPVPVGVPGELFVGGHGLARGYHRRPDLTRERFIDHPFRPGERLYRTGDQARYEPDGQIVYIGRTDFQVKVRGFRIELGEIEDVLRHCEGVADAVVVLREDQGQKRLVAYVVTDENGAADLGGVRAFAAQRLPEYMVPAAVVRLASFPMTPNQKVDRRALPPPPRDDDAPSILPPRNDAEREIAAIWTELLGPRPIGVRDDFYAIGGNSLLAVRMLSRLEAKHGKTYSLGAFNRRPTISGLAELQASDSDTGEDPLVVTIQDGDKRPPLWLFHPVGGHVVYGRWLQKHMHRHQPILAIQARGLDGKHPPLTTFEEMATLYYGLVREKQPHGPYFLAGPSMGGQIALEIAQRLWAAGERVALLALLDTRGPNYPRPTSAAVRFLDQVRSLSALPTWSERLAKLRERLSRPDSIPDPDRYDALGALAESGALVAAIERVTLANERANMAYRPVPYPGTIVLFRAARPKPWPGMRFDDPANGWGPLAQGGVRAIPIKCHHTELADTPPPEVGRGLQREIDEALAKIAREGERTGPRSTPLHAVPGSLPERAASVPTTP
jgi:amino acid adenylation domain-containing protein